MSEKRKGFNFYKSYFDVYQQLKTKDEKIQFIEALLFKQFHGIEPGTLKGMAEFAYISQKHSIDQQVKGWEDKMDIKIHPPTEGGKITPTEQLTTNNKQLTTNNGQQETIDSDKEMIFKTWLNYRKEINKPIKVESTLNILIKKFNSEEHQKIEWVVNASIENGWTGLFWSRYEQEKEEERKNSGKKKGESRTEKALNTMKEINDMLDLEELNDGK